MGSVSKTGETRSSRALGKSQLEVTNRQDTGDQRGRIKEREGDTRSRRNINGRGQLN